MTDINSSPDSSKPSSSGTPPIQKKPLWRRKWVQVIGAVVILLLLLVLLLPTIAGFGFVRNIVVGKINASLEPSGRVEIDDWSLGWTSGAVLRGVRYFDENGEKVVSIDKLTSPLSLIGAARGNLNFGRTTVEGLDCVLNLDEKSDISKKHSTNKKPKSETPSAPSPLPNINAQLVLEDGKIRIEGEKLHGSGVAKGDLTIKSDGSSNAIDGQLSVDSAELAGSALSGDTIKTNLTVPISILRQRVKEGTTTLTIKTLDIRSPELLEASVRGEVPEEALENIGAKKAPGQTGALDLTFKVPNLQAVAVQFSQAISLQPDVKVTGGELMHVTHLDIREKDVAITNRLTFSAQGTHAGQPIKIDNFEVSKANATFDPTRDSIASLGNIAVDIQSSFLTIKGGGATLSALNLPGTLNLDQLHDQLAKFIDFKDAKLSGTGTFDIQSVGDITSTTKPFNTRFDVAIQNLAVTLSGKPPIQLASLNLSSSATVDLNAGVIQHANASLQTGDGKKNIIDVDLNVDGIDLASNNVKHFDYRVNVMELAIAQGQIDPLVPALQQNGIKISTGQLYTNASGSVDGKTNTITFDKTNPLAFSTPHLTIQKIDEDGAMDVVRDENITASIQGEVSVPADGPIFVNMQALNVDTQPKLFSIRKSEGTDLTFKTGVGGSGSLAVSGDVKAVMDIVRRLGGSATVTTASGQTAPKTGDVTSGQLDATLALSHGSTAETAIALQGAVTNLSVTTADPKKPMVNETIKLDFKGSAKDDMSGASLSGTVESAFANLNLKQASFVNKGDQGQQLQQAEIEATIPDAAKAYALYVAFTPPTADTLTSAPAAPTGKKSKKSKAAPMPADASPFEITSGSATLNLKLMADSSAPANAKMLETMLADGLLTVPEVNAGGMEIKQLLIPLTVKGGVVRTVYKDKPEGQNKAPPATCNGGTLDFSDITCDLRQDTPRLTIAKNQRLILHVSINPLLGDTLGKFVNPVFAKSKRASGALDVTVADCQNLALGDKMKTPDSGKLRIGFSLSDMDIANPMGSLLLGGILKQFKIPSPPSDDADTFRGSIRDGIVSIDQGVATTDITLLLVDPSVSTQPASGKKKSQAVAGAMPLRFWGDVHLNDLTQSLKATIPTGLIGKFVGSIPFVKIKDPAKALASVFPKGIPVTVKGTTTDPKFDFADIGKQFGEGILKNPDNLQNIIKQLPKF